MILSSLIWSCINDVVIEYGQQGYADVVIKDAVNTDGVITDMVITNMGITDVDISCPHH